MTHWQGDSLSIDTVSLKSGGQSEQLTIVLPRNAIRIDIRRQTDDGEGCKQ
jgi:hypothetical protein